MLYTLYIAFVCVQKMKSSLHFSKFATEIV